MSSESSSLKALLSQKLAQNTLLLRALQKESSSLGALTHNSSPRVDAPPYVPKRPAPSSPRTFEYFKKTGIESPSIDSSPSMSSRLLSLRAHDPSLALLRLELNSRRPANPISSPPRAPSSDGGISLREGQTERASSPIGITKQVPSPPVSDSFPRTHSYSPSPDRASFHRSLARSIPSSLSSSTHPSAAPLFLPVSQSETPRAATQVQQETPSFAYPHDRPMPTFSPTLLLSASQSDGAMLSGYVPLHALKAAILMEERERLRSEELGKIMAQVVLESSRLDSNNSIAASKHSSPLSKDIFVQKNASPAVPTPLSKEAATSPCNALITGAHSLATPPTSGDYFLVEDSVNGGWTRKWVVLKTGEICICADEETAKGGGGDAHSRASINALPLTHLSFVSLESSPSSPAPPPDFKLLKLYASPNTSKPPILALTAYVPQSLETLFVALQALIKELAPPPQPPFPSERYHGPSASSVNFFKACAEGDAAKVSLVLSAGNAELAVSTRTSPAQGSATPGHLAAYGGHCEVLRLLAGAGADMVALCCEGRSLLAWAARRGQTNAVVYLMDHYPSLLGCASSSEGNSPLHEAVLSGNESTVEVLVGKAADLLKVKNMSGKAPVELAIDLYSDKGINSCEGGRWGPIINSLGGSVPVHEIKAVVQTPSDSCAYPEGTQPVAQSPPSNRAPFIASSIPIATESLPRIRSTSPRPYRVDSSVLATVRAEAAAARARAANVLNDLQIEGAVVDAALASSVLASTSSNVSTDRSSLSSSSPRTSQKSAVSTDTPKGSGESSDLTPAPYRPSSPATLYSSPSRSSSPRSQLYDASGPDSNNDIQTFVTLCTDGGSPEKLLTLLAKRPSLAGSVDASSKKTPLMLAARSGCERSTRVILAALESAGVDVTARDTCGRDALAYAARAGYASTMNVLLSHWDSASARNPFKISNVDLYGLNTLHHAVLSACWPAVQVAVTAGADQEARDVNDFTPLDVASYALEKARRGYFNVGSSTGTGRGGTDLNVYSLEAREAVFAYLDKNFRPTSPSREIQKAISARESGVSATSLPPGPILCSASPQTLPAPALAVSQRTSPAPVLVSPVLSVFEKDAPSSDPRASSPPLSGDEIFKTVYSPSPSKISDGAHSTKEEPASPNEVKDAGKMSLRRPAPAIAFKASVGCLPALSQPTPYRQPKNSPKSVESTRSFLPHASVSTLSPKYTPTYNARLETLVPPLRNTFAGPYKKSSPQQPALSSTTTALSMATETSQAIPGEPGISGADINPSTSASPEKFLRLKFLRSCDTGNIEVVEQLLSKDPSLTRIKDSHGRSPLHFAARCGLPALLLALQRSGADMRVLDEGGRSPLLYAVRKYALDAVRWLIAAGAPVSGPPDSFGLSALHHAVLSQAPGVVRILLEAGADPTAKDMQGNNPHQLAVQCATPGVGGVTNDRQWEVMELLTKAVAK